MLSIVFNDIYKALFVMEVEDGAALEKFSEFEYICSGNNLLEILNILHPLTSSKLEI